MKKLLMILLSAMFYAGCNSSNQNETPEKVQFTVESAPEWSNMFKRDSGWFGGDGIFAIPLNGKEIMEEGDTTRNLFVFSDTMVGTIKDGELQEGYTMVNNSIAILKGHDTDPSEMDFRVLKDSAGEPGTLFLPQTPQSEEEDYFWLGDGFVNPADEALYIFAYRIVNIPDQEVFGFKEVGNVLIKIPHGSTYPFKDMVQYDVPFHPDSAAVSFGAGIFANTKTANATDPDGYIYIYGVRGKDKFLVAARTRPEEMANFDKWEFWSGDKWVSEESEMTNIVSGVSNELSVSPISNGKYALVFQAGVLTNTVAMRIGDSPVGPFSDTLKLWDCSKDLEGKNFFAYNAKAHPSLSKPGELLISYNINSFDFFNDIKVYPNLYRPRFIRVKFK